MNKKTRVIPSRADGEGPLKRSNRFRETTGAIRQWAGNASRKRKLQL